MTPTHWPLTLPLVLLAIGCAYVQLRRVAARSRPYPVALLIASLALWTPVGWLTHWPLAWVAGASWGGVLVLVVTGILLGAVGGAQVGAGAALAFTFWQ